MTPSLRTALLTLAAFAAGGGAMFLAMHHPSPPPPGPPVAPETAAAPVPPPRATTPLSSPAPEKSPATTNSVRRTPEETAAILAAIQDATVEYSESTLPLFANWLRDPSREVRDAATEGLLQSGLAGGAPLLRAAAANAHDREEADAQERAAGILELPPATEAILEMRKNRRNKAPAEHFNLNERLHPAAPALPPSEPADR